MNPSLPNAFISSGSTPYRSLAAAMSPLRVSQSRATHGWTVTLNPMRAVHVLEALPGYGESESHVNLVYDVEQTTWCDEQGRPVSIGDIVDRLSITPLERFGADALVLDDQSLLDLLGIIKPQNLRIVRVDGPIEAGDAKAMRCAYGLGVSPLELELRATVAIEVTDDRTVTLDVRDRFDGLAVVAQNFRHYLGALRGQPASDFDAPETWQVERLLSLTGAMQVRPIETEMFATFIDVGISTESTGEPIPADRSLIYDLPSHTWHDEP